MSSSSFDVLSLEDGTVKHGQQGLPEEELLRLDDGTRLPAELSELRTLLQMHAAAAAEAQPTADSDDPEHASQLAAIACAKADMLRDCLLGFDEGMLLMHDKLLDHERMVKRLEAMRRVNAQPGRKHAYDEAVAVADDDDEIDLSDLLAVDAPGGAGGTPDDDRTTRDGSSRSAEQAASSADVDAEEEVDEELLDQRVAASRHQIKAWVRALEQGKQEDKRRVQRQQGDLRAASGLVAEGVVPGAKKLQGPKAPLAPVRPPPRARESSYSLRLRARARTGLPS